MIKHKKHKKNKNHKKDCKACKNTVKLPEAPMPEELPDFILWVKIKNIKNPIKKRKTI